MCQKYSCQKLLKFANICSSYDRYCQGCFFRFSVYFNTFRLICFPEAVQWVMWETERTFDGRLCLEYLFQKLSKFVNWISSHSRKCRRCFFDTQCRLTLCIVCRRLLPVGVSEFWTAGSDCDCHSKCNK